MRVALGAALMVTLLARGGISQPARVPILVELYTSEGCSSCPPADALLESLQREQPVAGAEIVSLGLHVDYFNQLGWKDAFSSATFTARQDSYSAVFGSDNLYTPQIVVDGAAAIPGNESALVRRAVAAAVTRPHSPLRLAASVAGDKVMRTIDVSAMPSNAERMQLLAAITEDGMTSIVNKGENQGRTLHHVAVVRHLQLVGPIAAKAAPVQSRLQIERGWGPHLKAVVWLQAAKSRHVYGAASIPLAR